ncbi:MAG: hypothetical protein J5I93_08990 [Pirellulaceae bacterium]|nr:hypothetical protein [Pirellulaceae bacterium]
MASLLLVFAAAAPTSAAPPGLSQGYPPIGLYGGSDVHTGDLSDWRLASAQSESAAADAVGAAACDSCLCGDCCCKPWHVVTGVEATFLHPQVQDTPLYHLTPIGLEITSRLASLDDYYAAPRVWLGWQHQSGHGVRARYWDFEASAWNYDAFLVPLAPEFFDIGSYNATNKLEAYTIDLEYTRRFCFQRWQMLGSIGARHAKLDRAEMLNSLTTDLISGPTPLGVTSQIISERQMSGTGLTLGLEAIRPLNHWNLNLFCSGRGSALWGDNRSTNLSTMYIAPAGLGPGAISTANVLLLDDQDTMYILEFQVGVEWRCPLKCICAEMFIRAAFEYQYWDVEEVSGDYLTQVVLDVDPINFGETRDLRAQFTGLAFAIGIAW